MKKLGCILMSLLLVCMTGVFAVALTPAERLAEAGILAGDTDGNLRLDEPVSRAELAKMLALAVGAADNGEVSFTDVPENHWAYESIAKAVSLGIINGYEDGSFRPDAPVTYEEAVKMTLAAFGMNAGYPFGYMAAAIDAGYLDGIPAVMGEAATRGEIASLLVRAMDQEAAGGDEDMSWPQWSSASSGGGGGAVISAEMDSGIMPTGDVSSASVPIIGEGWESHNTEEYAREEENRFKDVATSPLSTFSIDVDTASYSNTRRFLLSGNLPQLGAVRTEELVNYFAYDYPEPEDGRPLSVSAEVHPCPWNPSNQLAMIAMQGAPQTERVEQNLVFLLDTSGSMYASNKLPLVKKAMTMLTEQLTESDRVSIVTYAGNTSVALDGVPGSDKERILSVIDNLYASGSTAGGAGIQLAYDTAVRNRVDGNNRVILCTDGDFNVGISSTAELESLIEGKRDEGIFLSVLGFGIGNYKDSRMETLADHGNGNYAYIDNEREAKKVLVDDMTKTLVTVAKDVKLQVEFNPQLVKQYRLIGYENRRLENEDFADDAKDAGELGAGQSVTAFYELVPADGSGSGTELRYQESTTTDSEEMMCISVRYKLPDRDESELLELPVAASDQAEASENYRFASAVAGFGQLLGGSEYLKGWTYRDILAQAESSIGEDPYGLRTEFIQLVGMAQYLEREPVGGTLPSPQPVLPW